MTPIAISKNCARSTAIRGSPCPAPFSTPSSTVPKPPDPKESVMHAHKIVSQEEWTQARKALLAKEKALLKAHDALAAERRALPWVKVEKNYEFEGPAGRQTLADLFD